MPDPSASVGEIEVDAVDLVGLVQEVHVVDERRLSDPLKLVLNVDLIPGRQVKLVALLHNPIYVRETAPTRTCTPYLWTDWTLCISRIRSWCFRLRGSASWSPRPPFPGWAPRTSPAFCSMSRIRIQFSGIRTSRPSGPAAPDRRSPKKASSRVGSWRPLKTGYRKCGARSRRSSLTRTRISPWCCVRRRTRRPMRPIFNWKAYLRKAPRIRSYYSRS